jgi:hypothetical protein
MKTADTTHDALAPGDSNRRADAVSRAFHELRAMVERVLAVTDDPVLLDRLRHEVASTVTKGASDLSRAAVKLRVERAHERRPRGPTLTTCNGWRGMEHAEVEVARRTAHQVLTVCGRRFDLRSGAVIGGERSYLTRESLEVARALPVGETDVSRALTAIEAMKKAAR